MTARWYFGSPFLTHCRDISVRLYFHLFHFRGYHQDTIGAFQSSQSRNLPLTLVA